MERDVKQLNAATTDRDRAGEAYVDVGALHGYREANQLLDSRHRGAGPAQGVPAFQPAATPLT